MVGPVEEIPIASSDKADEKEDASSPETSETKSPPPPPDTAEPPAKSNPPKSPPSESPSPPEKNSPDNPQDSKPAAEPPPSDPTPDQASNNNNNNNDDNKSTAPEKKSPSSSSSSSSDSSSSSSSSTPATPSGGDENSPPAEQSSTPSSSTFAAPNTRQDNKPVGSGPSTDPLIPLPPGNAGVSGIHSNSGGSDASVSGSGIPAPWTSPSPEASKPLHPGVVVGLTLAAVCICGLIAFLIACAMKRKKKKKKGYKESSHAKYMPSPNKKLSVNSDDRGGPQKLHNLSGSNSGGNGYEGSPGSHRGGPRNPESPLILGGVTFFSYEELVEITNGFAPQNVIGEGGFGCVFKGCLLSGKLVAVKQLKVGGKQGEREFRAEVDIISRIHHRHLVSLVGYCIFNDQRILIYEFVPNNNLEHHLRGTPLLDWSKRVKIAIGAAKGLAYLHEDCSPKIIHRDIKTANILLDSSFEAKVADFGLAKIAEDSKTHVSTRVMGTFGYMAPEYANSGKLTDRSDVYSYGVVLLELVTGRKPVDPTQPLGEESLVEWARPLLLRTIETGDCSELVDPRLEKNYVESEMITMIEAAAACIRHSAPRRPRMVQVIRALDTHFDMSDLSNGMKYGESTIYDSGQYNEEIAKFRRSRFESGNEESIEYSMYSSNELSLGPASSGEFTSGESETRPFYSSIGRRGRQFK